MARLDRLLSRALDEGLEGVLPDDPEDARLLTRLYAAALGRVPALDQSPVGHEALAQGLSATLARDGAGPGTRIGPFEIESAIGSGGMGTVYRAHRVDGGFEQRVALKLLSSSQPNPVLFQLFQRERQLLAQLDHPGIARLIDGGLTEGWQPWFAMEFIEGQALHDYADAQRLSVRQRLELLVQVCDALDHAHRRLVIHRDIKPGNLLVDDASRVHVVDFGLGRSMAADPAGGETTATIAAGHLTPQYASPEQARGEPVSVASDVYQLGLVLYRLLCGCLPYDTAGLSAYALAERVSAASIERPSSQWQGPDADERARAMFGLPARAVRRALRGDIDNIVLAALARQPRRRYAGASELGQDLERHLAHEPVTTRAATRRYRIGRFVRRHALPAGLAGAVTLLLIAGLVTVSLQSRQLAQERDRALASAERNERLADALAGMIRLSDASGPIDQLFTVGERLEQYRDHVETELAADPRLQARLFGILGEAFQNIRYWSQARDALQRALKLYRRSGSGNVDRMRQLKLSLAESEAFADDLPGALSRLERLATQARESNDTKALADVLYQSGYIRTYHFQPGSAEFAVGIDDLQAALDAYRSLYTPPHPAIARTLHTLGMKHPDPETALSLARRGIEMSESIFGASHPITAIRLAELALLHDRLGDYAQAARIGRRAHAMHVRLRGDTHPESLTMLSNLAGSLRESGRLEESAGIYRRLHELRKKTLPEDHLLLAYTAHGLGNTLRELGEFARSQTWLREALRICLLHDSPKEAITRENLSRTLEAAGRLDQALSQQQAAVAAYRHHGGADHPALPAALERLAGLEDLAAAPGDPNSQVPR